MRATIRHLLDDLMALPLATRAMLAEKLVESVEGYADPGIQQAWQAEIARRVDEYESGTVTTIAAEAVARDARKLLVETHRVSA